MIEITPTLSIDERDIQIDLIRSPGPGGQNVNKVATAVQLRFDIANSHTLAPDVKKRLIKISGNRVTDGDVLVIIARRFRSQERNRLDAIQRLTTLIGKALEKPKTRKATLPNATAIEARLGKKKKRGETKRARHYIPDD